MVSSYLFTLYNILILTIVIMLYLRHLELSQVIISSLSLSNILIFPTIAPGICLPLCFYEFILYTSNSEIFIFSMFR